MIHLIIKDEEFLIIIICEAGIARVVFKGEFFNIWYNMLDVKKIEQFIVQSQSDG